MATPIGLTINAVDYSAKVLFVEHREEAYRDSATIILNNTDRTFDAVDLRGYRFRISYDGTSTADLWVTSQQLISSPGVLECQLECIGQWSLLRYLRLVASADTFAVTDPSLITTDPYSTSEFPATFTVYELINKVLVACGMSIGSSPSPDDGILNTFKPYYSFEQFPYAATVLENLISMTNCYLRPGPNLSWAIVYPQASDAVTKTFYSRSTSGTHFTDYAERKNVLIPNRIIVLANYTELDATNLIIGDTGAYTPQGDFPEIIEPHPAPAIESQTDADNRAGALLTKIAAENQTAGYLIAPHQNVNLYDRIQIVDERGT